MQQGKKAKARGARDPLVRPKCCCKNGNGNGGCQGRRHGPLNWMHAGKITCEACANCGHPPFWGWIKAEAKLTSRRLIKTWKVGHTWISNLGVLLWMEFALGIGLRQEPAFVKVAKVELAQRLGSGCVLPLRASLFLPACPHCSH